MKTNLLVFLSLTLFSTTVPALASGGTTHPQPQAYEGWRLGVQTWSFNRFTLFEAIDKTRSLGLGYIQAFPGQKVSKKMDVPFDRNLSGELKAAVRAKLQEAGVSIFAFGVVGISEEEAEARKLFEFAKEMGIETIASEPKPEQFDLIDKLCQDYQINLAIHNHPKPSRYWNPDTVLEVCQGRSKWIGACADVGHWVRSGLDPVDCLKKLEGRIYDLHIKEIDDNHDVVWGTGQGRIKGILEELHRQGYAGTFSVEYEYHWDNNVPDIRQSVAYFDSVAATLKPSGWKSIFDPKLSNASFNEKGWAIEDGELVSKGNGDIWTVDKYSNFVLDCEFKLEKHTNSGIFIRSQNHEWLPWVEVQIEDSYGKALGKHICGGIFDVKEPRVNAVHPAGQWNRMTIVARDSKVDVILNNQVIQELDLNDWTEAHKNPDGSANKFDVAYKDLPRTGLIGFQDHGTVIRYRNIRIKEL